MMPRRHHYKDPRQKSRLHCNDAALQQRKGVCELRSSCTWLGAPRKDGPKRPHSQKVPAQKDRENRKPDEKGREKEPYLNSRLFKIEGKHVLLIPPNQLLVINAFKLHKGFSFTKSSYRQRVGYRTLAYHNPKFGDGWPQSVRA